MKDQETRRLLDVKVVPNSSGGFSRVEIAYPAMFTFSCRLNVVHFPFDTQNCTLIFGSWTEETSAIDYFPMNTALQNFIENDAWSLLSFHGKRHVLQYSCCAQPYTNLYYHIVIRRKPLFYMVNLIVPTSVITLISLVGFFMPSSSNGQRNEKITLGITTLLSMSILLLMVSDKMPTTSDSVPLIGKLSKNTETSITQAPD